MSAVRHHAQHEAAVERVRAAVHAVGPYRMANVIGWGKRLLAARAGGDTLRAIGEREGVSRQAIYYRERKLLRGLGR